MAYSSIEDAYLARLTAVQFPDMPVEHDMAEPAAEPAASVDGMVLAAGPSQTVSDAGAGRGSYAGFDVRQDVANKGAQPEMRAYDPTTRERIASFLQAGFEGLGMDRYKARKNAQTLIGGPSSNLPLDMGLADIVPFLGTGLQTEEAVRMGEDAVTSAKQGNYGTAALQAGGAALGLVPGAAGTAKAAMAVGRAGERLAEKTVPQIMEKGGTMAELLQALSHGSRSQLTAYHGTPHTVDKFDSKKIGTGEGNQSFGYGLYFAENPAVANDYRFIEREWFDTAKAKYKGKSIDQHYEMALQAQDRAQRLKDQKAISQANAQLSFWENVMTHNHPEQVVGNALEDPSDWPELAAFAKTIDLKGFKGIPKPGNFYTVDIPDDMASKMLDWDGRIGDQSPEVQALAKQFGLSVDDLGGDLLAAAGGKTPKGAQLMKEAGITGVRYFDKGSRDLGKGTRNIVVFPGGEDQIKILKQEGKK